MLPIDGIQYRGATVAFLGPTHRFLYSHGVYVGDFYVGDQKSTLKISNEIRAIGIVMKRRF